MKSYLHGMCEGHVIVSHQMRANGSCALTMDCTDWCLWKDFCLGKHNLSSDSHGNVLSKSLIGKLLFSMQIPLYLILQLSPKVNCLFKQSLLKIKDYYCLLSEQSVINWPHEFVNWIIHRQLGAEYILQVETQCLAHMKVQGLIFHQGLVWYCDHGFAYSSLTAAIQPKYLSLRSLIYKLQIMIISWSSCASCMK